LHRGDEAPSRGDRAQGKFIALHPTLEGHHPRREGSVFPFRSPWCSKS
jgi:hypothetical protein